MNETRHSPQIINDLNEAHISSSESFTSSASPIQEIGYMDDLFPYIDDMFTFEKIKPIHDFPSIDDINDILGMNNDQKCCLSTPITSFSFFP